MKTESSGAGFRIGPGMPSLLMMLVTLLMAALAILAMAGAQTDAALSQRNLETAQNYYGAAAQMQRELAEVDRLLLDAREAAAGDAGAYEALVRDLQAGYPADTADTVNDDGGLLLRIAVPMRNGDDNNDYLEVLLQAPVQLTGPRYTVRSHRLTDDAPWEAEQDLGVLQDWDILDIQIEEP